MKTFSHDRNYFSRTEVKKYALAGFSNSTVPVSKLQWEGDLLILLVSNFSRFSSI